jgi:hypothetical protein
MLDDTIVTIETTLARLEQRQTLWDEGNFVERVHALDTLVLQILERIENVQYVYGYQATLAPVSQRAERLWQRLNVVQTQLVQRLRQRLITHPCPGVLLPQLWETYVGEAAQDSTVFDMTYLDVFLNGILGIDTRPEETHGLLPEMIAYYPTPAPVILALIEHAQLNASDVFYDLGSGLGRVALLVGLLTAAQAKGIEFEPAYCTYAQHLARELCLSHVTFYNADARHCDYADGTVFFLYTPFTGRLLQDVLARLRAVAHTRPITIATYGACTRDVSQQPWVQLTVQQTFPPDTLALFRSR